MPSRTLPSTSSAHGVPVMSPATDIHTPATTTTTGRRVRHIAAAADQSWRASSFGVAVLIRSARLAISDRSRVRNYELGSLVEHETIA